MKVFILVILWLAIGFCYNANAEQAKHSVPQSHKFVFDNFAANTVPHLESYLIALSSNDGMTVIESGAYRQTRLIHTKDSKGFIRFSLSQLLKQLNIVAQIQEAEGEWRITKLAQHHKQRLLVVGEW